MAEHHQFAHHPHPPSAPDRLKSPEAQNRRGAAAGAEVEREMEAKWKGANRKIGTMVAKTMPVGGKGQR